MTITTTPHDDGQPVDVAPPESPSPLAKLYDEWINKRVRVKPRDNKPAMIGTVKGVDPRPMRYVGSCHMADSEYLMVVLDNPPDVHYNTYAKVDEVELIS